MVNNSDHIERLLLAMAATYTSWPSFVASDAQVPRTKTILSEHARATPKMTGRYITMVSEAVKPEPMFDGLGRHLVGILRPPCASDHGLIDGYVAGREAVGLRTFAQLVEERVYLAMPQPTPLSRDGLLIGVRHMKVALHLLEPRLRHVVGDRVGSGETIVSPIVRDGW
jgi:hypothetical protein